jgi:hypothetical protein
VSGASALTAYRRDDTHHCYEQAEIRQGTEGIAERGGHRNGDGWRCGHDRRNEYCGTLRQRLIVQNEADRIDQTSGETPRQIDPSDGTTRRQHDHNADLRCLTAEHEQPRIDAPCDATGKIVRYAVAETRQ